ncbi:MAG: hypothetical protein IEMM0008_1033 [bacterium]|nr:MAG: hypothetical protein IEMM0008_1033 [bacterium]
MIDLMKAFKTKPIHIILLSLCLICFSYSMGWAKDYELQPFKLKILPPQKNVADPLDSFRVVSTLKYTPRKKPSQHHIGLVFGYPFLFNSGIDKVTKTNFPFVYIAANYRHTFFNSESLFLDYELGYMDFGLKLNNNPIDFTVRNLSFTFSLVWRLRLANGVYLNPALGVGYRYLIIKVPNVSDTVHFFYIRPMLTFSFDLADNIELSFGASLSANQDTQESFGKNTVYFLLPRTGIHYKF